MKMKSTDFNLAFRKQHSTADCSFVLKRTINSYLSTDRYVFACFIDFNKAFDNVDYWLLFYKLGPIG